MSRKADREREDRRRVAETIDSPVAAPRPTSPVPMRANGDANMASSSSSQDEGISVLQAQLHEALSRCSKAEAELPSLRKRLAESEANCRKQEAQIDNVRHYEEALSNVQQEVEAYQSVLAQTQDQYNSLEDKYNKAKKLIRSMHEHQREVVLKIRHREAGFHSLLQALQHRTQLLELHLVEAQKAAGLPVVIPPGPSIPSTLGFLSAGLIEPSFDDIDLVDIGLGHSDSIVREIKEEFDQAIPAHEPLDTSAARSRAELASRGIALRQSPSQGLLRRSGAGTSMSSNSSLEHSIDEPLSSRDADTSGEMMTNRTAYFQTTSTSRSMKSVDSAPVGRPAQTVSYTSNSTSAQYYQQQQQMHHHHQQQHLQQQQHLHQQQQHYHVSSSIERQEMTSAFYHEHLAVQQSVDEHRKYSHHHHHQQQQQQQQRAIPEQHMTEQLKQLLVERELKREMAAQELQRLQPLTSSNRSLAGVTLVQQQQQQQQASHIFYPVRHDDGFGNVEMRTSIRAPVVAAPVPADPASCANNVGPMTDSACSSIGSISSSSSTNVSWQNVQVNEWTPEQVGSWLRSIGLEVYAVHFAANGVGGEELVEMESPKLKLLVPHATERARLKQRLKELKLAFDKEKKLKEREKKEKEKLQRKAEKLAEKASKKK